MRLLAVCVLAALLAPATVAAHQSATSRVHNARHIAQTHWGDGQCSGVTPMTVPIGRGPMPPGSDWVAYISRGPGPPYTDCRIVLKDQAWPTEYLCRVIGHEVGHMAGRDHSPDPASIMFGGALAPWPPCAFGAADTAPRPPPSKPAEPPPSMQKSAYSPQGPLVLVLPGGGFQNADPETMRPWVEDFARHGIRARPITYPLRDVLAAIEHVRQVAATEPRPVVCYGISAGGTICAALAARGQVAGAVNVVGPTDFTRWVGPGADRIMRQIGMTTPQAKRAASPFWMLAGRQAPQLVQCGLADPLVTWDQCQRYAAAAHKGQPDTRLHSLVNAHSQSSRDRAIAREWIHARFPSHP